jgi:hypothetical protein
MKLFLHAHATHPDWRMALALATAQLQAQQARDDHIDAPTLGWVYLSDHYAAHAEHLLDELRAQWPGVAWVGSVGVGIAANGVEYFDEPALALMLGDIAPEHFRIFSGLQPLSAPPLFAAVAAQVHADPAAHDAADLISELAGQTRCGPLYLFGGLASARNRSLHIANGVLQGGLSGVAFDANVPLISRVTQGCQPVGPVRQITSTERNLVLTLDGEPALDCLLRDMAADDLEPRDALRSAGYNAPMPQLHALYMAVPFLHELRQVLDWVCTPTSLDLGQWTKLDAVHTQLYLTQADMVARARWRSCRRRCSSACQCRARQSPRRVTTCERAPPRWRWPSGRPRRR